MVWFKDWYAGSYEEREGITMLHLWHLSKAYSLFSELIFYFLLRTFFPHLGQRWKFGRNLVKEETTQKTTKMRKKVRNKLKINSQIKKPHLKMIPIKDKSLFSVPDCHGQDWNSRFKRICNYLKLRWDIYSNFENIFNFSLFFIVLFKLKIFIFIKISFLHSNTWLIGQTHKLN